MVFRFVGFAFSARVYLRDVSYVCAVRMRSQGLGDGTVIGEGLAVSAARE
jgi:hypothetical protein